MEHYSKGVTFRNKNYGTEEFFSFEELDEQTTFDQIAVELWDRHRRKKSGFRTDVDAPERHVARQSVQFSWMPPTGNGSQLINGAGGVLEFLHKTGAREILYYITTDGGTSLETFQRHGQEIVDQPRAFGVWEWGLAQDSTPQLQKVVLDKFRRVVHVFIRPVTRYPEAPPSVVTRPPFPDQCFSSGELQWARAGEAGQLVWSEHCTSPNPLAELIDELRRKYHVF